MISNIHYWTVDEVKSIALKYETRYEFFKENKNAYNWVRTHKILDEVCQHMHSAKGNNQFTKK